MVWTDDGAALCGRVSTPERFCSRLVPRGSEVSFYNHSIVQDLRAGDRARFWFAGEGERQVARVGTVIGFVMTGEGVVTVTRLLS